MIKDNKINQKQIICYDSDASRLIGKTEKVIFPRTAEQVQQAIKTTDLDIVPRGAGTNLVGGCIPNNSVVIDLSKMNKTFKFEPKKRTIIVGAGVTIKELNEKLNAVGFEFPIQPLNSSATIGGMIATNASGNHILKYGTIKEWIEEIKFVNGRGELVKTTKADLLDVCGMEGITGIITEATLAIIPKQNKSISIFQSDNLDEVLSMTRRLKLEKEVIMLKLLSPFVSELLNLPGKYNLIVEFNSERGKIKGGECKKIQEITDKIYHVLFSEGYYNVEDPKFFFDKLKEFISFLEINQIPYFSYLGAGIVHPFFKDNEQNKRNAVIDFIKKSRAKPSKFGIGLLRKDLIDPLEKKIIERVKLRHDPFGKLNKGKLIDTNLHEKRMQTIKPNLGEEKSVKSMLNEIKEEKINADQKMQELIKEAKEIEEIEKQIYNQQASKENIKETFDEQILSSDLSNEVQEFTKNLTREIALKEITSSIKNQGQIPKPPQKPSITKEDYKTIQDIMTNKFKKQEDKKDEHRDK